VGRVLNPDRSDMESAKITRDRAATLLETMMDEVRAAGAFLFRRNPEILPDYRDLGR
jgi:hypothetical protein